MGPTKKNFAENILIPPEIINAFQKKNTGYNLLVKGKAGSGKTTFAMSIMAFFKNITPIYLSTRVAPRSLYSQFPWLKDKLKSENIIDATRTYIPPTKDPKGEQMKEHLLHTIRFQSLDDFLKEIYKKIQNNDNPIIIIDSWDAIINQNFDKNDNVETLFTEFVRQTRAKLVLIAETEKFSHILEYIVDGVVTLRDGADFGRTLRTFEINKIRSIERRQKAYAYTLYKNQFCYTLPYKRKEVDDISAFQPLPDNNELFSTGNQEIDRLYEGGLRPGTFNLLEVESTVPISAISAIFVGMLCQFISRGRGAIVHTTDGINSDLIQKKRLFLYLKTDAISKYLRILQTQISDRKEIRPYIQLTDEDNFNEIFFDTYSKLSSLSKFQPVFAGFAYDSLRFMVDFNKSMQDFQQHLKLIRNSNVIELGILNSRKEDDMSQSLGSLTSDISYVSSTHIKVIERHGTIFIFSIKPKSPCLYEMRTNYEKGFPQIELIPIV